jgi:NhaP-type Na+/H+ or K+/H+ antiporter
MSAYIVVLTGFGALVLLTAWLPMLLKELPLSLPIICVCIGAFVFSLPYAGPAPNLLDYPELIERVTELVVIIALMGAGLKLDRPLSFATSRLTWRLLLFAMPATILVLGILGYYLLGLGLASALLLAAALAPTDPVLASDVQVGGPRQGLEDEVRFTLTSEAGLNDGLAFPFVNLALAITLAVDASWFSDWLLFDVVWKVAAGVAMGWITGRFLGWLIFRLPNRAKLSRTGDGFVALGITCLAYGLTELMHGYGFLAVFVAALGVRAAERSHSYHEKLHDFAEQLERLLMMGLLVIFGGAALTGGLLQSITLEAAVFALLAIVIVRPVCGWASLAGSGNRMDERAVISFFGIRGIGSVYYLAYATNRGEFAETDLLWSVTALIILISIALHGATVTPVMRQLDRRLVGPTAASPKGID